jgi:hypothetical protein
MSKEDALKFEIKDLRIEGERENKFAVIYVQEQTSPFITVSLIDGAVTCSYPVNSAVSPSAMIGFALNSLMEGKAEITFTFKCAGGGERTLSAGTTCEIQKAKEWIDRANTFYHV